MAARHKEGYYCRNEPIHFILWKRLSIDDVGVSRDTVFDDNIRPGAGLETGD